MDDRAFLIDLKRGLSIMANDPSVGELQKRGLKAVIVTIEKRVQALTPPKADRSDRATVPQPRRTPAAVLE